MAPPRKPAAEVKRPTAVSLNKAQRATLKKMGGSAWLQNILDHEAHLMARATSPRLPGRATARRELAGLRFDPVNFGVVTIDAKKRADKPTAKAKKRRA